MRKLYYVVLTLIHSRDANVIKIISLALGLMMSVLLFARVAFDFSVDTCFKDYRNLYQFRRTYNRCPSNLLRRLTLLSRFS